MVLRDSRRVMDTNDPFPATLLCTFILDPFLSDRKSNFVPPSKVGFDRTKYLFHAGIILSKDYILVYIKWS